MDRRELLQSLSAVLAMGAVPTCSGLVSGGEGNQTRLRGINLNHVMIRVPDVDQAKAFYVDKFGFREVFSFKNAGRKPAFSYLQISQSTFLELQPASDEHPPGLGHVGLAVSNIDHAVETLRARGLTARDPGTSRQTGARISSVQAAGVTFELLEFPADSLVRKAMNSWK